VAPQAGPSQIVSDWQALGGALDGGVAAASWGTFESEIFAVDARTGEVLNRYWDGASWHAWEPLGGEFTGTPAASARDADRIDVLAIGRDGILRQRWWDGTQWAPWREVPGAPGRAVAVSCSWIGAELRVFVVGPDRAVRYLALRE